ncbi:ubiquitin-binding protein cue5, partial [Ascosphaera atra]
MEAQTKFNSFFSTLKKKLEGEEEDNRQAEERYGRYEEASPRPLYEADVPSYTSRRSAEGRRSADRNRYDADAHELGDGFSALELRDTE